MLSVEVARQDWAKWARWRPVHWSMALTEEGLVLGAGTVLAKAVVDRSGRPALAVNDAEDRILTLLAIAYGKPIDPTVLDQIRRASEQWSRGQTCLALIHLAYTGLPRLSDENEASFRLFLADRAISNGVPPLDLLKAHGTDAAYIDSAKAGYNPAQPRVPAGSGRESGWWTGRDAPAFLPRPTKLPVEYVAYEPVQSPQQDQRRRNAKPVGYKPVHRLPDDARVVIPLDGVPIEDEDSPTRKLMAPPHADFRQVYAAGKSIASEPPLFQAPLALAAIGQGGTFDFQRDPARGLFYHAYKNAANYAVGVYMAGAGYSLVDTFELAQAYALMNSSNYGDQKPRDWITQGWRDAHSGRWEKKSIRP